MATHHTDGVFSPTSSQASGITIRTQNAVTTSLNYPTLSKSDSESVRRFLRKYDQYVIEVEARHKQIAPAESTEPARPVALKFCVDLEWLHSIIAMGIIKDDKGENIDAYESLTEMDIRVCLDKKDEASKETIALYMLDCVVRESLRMDMSDRSAKSRMESLFISYHTLLRQHSLGWVIKDAPKVAVLYVISKIRPASLQSRLKDYLDLSHHDLKKDFKGFFAHAVKLAEAFQLVDDGPRRRKEENTAGRVDEGAGSSWIVKNGGKNDKGTASTRDSCITSAKALVRRNFPPCPHPPCQVRLTVAARSHFIDKCDWSTPEEQAKYKAEYRRQKSQSSAAALVTKGTGDDPIANRTRSKIAMHQPRGKLIAWSIQHLRITVPSKRHCRMTRCRWILWLVSMMEAMTP